MAAPKRFRDRLAERASADTRLPSSPELEPLIALSPLLMLHAVDKRPLPDWLLALIGGAMLAFMTYFVRSAAPRFIYFQF